MKTPMIGLRYDLEKSFTIAMAIKGVYLDIREDITLDKMDILVILGGDGYILHEANAVAKSGFKIPLFRVNTGHVGYLANVDITMPDMNGLASCTNLIDKLYKREFILKRRTRIACYINDKYVDDALNDIVIERIYTRPITIYEQFEDDSNYLMRRGDGLIVATQTGSSAYNRAAGAPILVRDSFISTVICPADLTFGSFRIFNTDEILNVHLFNPWDNARVVLDGNEIARITSRDRIKIIKSDYSNYFIEFGDD